MERGENYNNTMVYIKVFTIEYYSKLNKITIVYFSLLYYRRSTVLLCLYFSEEHRPPTILYMMLSFLYFCLNHMKLSLRFSSTCSSVVPCLDR